METGIAPSVWLDEGAAAIVTASVILEEQAKRAEGKQTPGPGGPQMSG